MIAKKVCSGLLPACFQEICSSGSLDPADGSVGPLDSGASRRRCLSILDHVYRAKPSGPRSQSFLLSGELTDELLIAVALLPQADVDFRAKAAPLVIASDASSTAEAAAACVVSSSCSQELYRHTLAKGLWNRLLAP